MGQELYAEMVAKLREVERAVPDTAPSGVADVIWRLRSFLNDLDQRGETAAKKADPDIWALVFKD